MNSMRVGSVWVMAWLACLATARAEPTAAPVGVAAGGLRGLEHSGLVLAPTGAHLSATVGYGHTESIGPVEGAHHRLASSWALGVVPLPWLALSLRLDGRYDVHPEDDEGPDHTGAGQPRLQARVGRALSRSLQAGAEVEVWFPGQAFPSLVPRATTLQLKSMWAWTPRVSAWTVLGALGYRLDNSGRAAPDLQRLRPGDRIALGLSDFDAVLLAVGAVRRLGASAELYGEVSADLLVGSDRPSVTTSPMRVSLGGRYALSPALQAELSTTWSLSARPEVGADDALVPIEPRFTALVGLRYTFAQVTRPSAGASPPPTSPFEKPAKPVPETGTVTGVLLDDRGEPLPDASVRLETGNEVRETVTDGMGRYSFRYVPFGPTRLRALAVGFAAQSRKVDVTPEVVEQPPWPLPPQSELGLLRGLTRSFASVPLRAQITIRSNQGKTVTSGESDDDGFFEFGLSPGIYRVTIQAAGYRAHTATVRISGTDVTILNVDLRDQ